MSEEITEENQQVINKLVEAVAQELASGKSREKIVKDIVQKWRWDEQDASAFVANVYRAVEQYQNSPEGKKILADKYKKHMIYGALWFIGGTAVTIGTWVSASNGGMYIVSWGAIIFGLVDFFRGLNGWQKNKIG